MSWHAYRAIRDRLLKCQGSRLSLRRQDCKPNSHTCAGIDWNSVRSPDRWTPCHHRSLPFRSIDDICSEQRTPDRTALTTIEIVISSQSDGRGQTKRYPNGDGPVSARHITSDETDVRRIDDVSRFRTSSESPPVLDGRHESLPLPSTRDTTALHFPVESKPRQSPP
jgi:hypothetical protein